MKRKIILFMMIAACAIFAQACQTGDDADPGTPKHFRFICDTATGASECDTPNTRLLVWTASGDDGDDGTAVEYDMRWSMESMSGDRFENAKKFYEEPEPGESGSTEVILLPRIRPEKEISFGLKARDEVSRESGLAKTSKVTLNFLAAPLRFYRHCFDGIDNDGDTLFDTDDPECASSLDGSEEFVPGGPVVPGFGSVISAVGNITDSGRRDVVAGAPGAISSLNGDDTGSVSLFLALNNDHVIIRDGKRTRIGSARPAVIIYGESSGDLFGAAVYGDDDFNRDKFNDFVVGAPGADKAYIFFGGKLGRLKLKKVKTNPARPLEVSAADAADVIITGPPGTSFGAAVALLGKMNGRTGSELAIGAPLEDKVYFFYGGFKAVNALNDDSVLPVLLDLSGADWADWTLEGPVASNFGGVLSRIKDLDGLGRDELAVGATGIDSVFIFYGGKRLAKAIDFALTGPQVWTYDGTNFDLLVQGPVGSEFGAAISELGLPSGRNVGSLAIGAPAEDRVYVIHGGKLGVLAFPTPSPTLYDVAAQGADWVFEGDAGTRFGEAVSIRSDLDDNRRHDVIIGAPDALDPGGAQVGAVYAFYSKDKNPLLRTTAKANATMYGQAPGGRFGAGLAGLFDQKIRHISIIHRNYSDLVAGAPGADSAFLEF